MTLESVLSDPLLERLGWMLLHSVWQGVAAAAVLAIALVLLRKRSASARYLASCAALFVLPIALAVTFALLPQRPRIAHIDSSAIVAPPAIVGFAVPAHPAQLSPTPPPTVPQMLEQFFRPALPWMVVAWFAGVVLLAIHHTRSWLLVRRWARDNQPIELATWRAIMARIVRDLRISRAVRLCESTLVDNPCAIGWLKPIVLIPLSATTGLAPQQIEGILAHELAHVRRNDYLVNLVQTVVETLLFYHPAVWWISRRIATEREHCCDDLAATVCGDRRRYARALVAMEELRQPGLTTMIGAGARFVMAARGSGDGSLVWRVRRLLGLPQVTRQRRRSWPLAATFLALLCAAAPLVAVQLTARAQAQSARSNTAATRPAAASDPFGAAAAPIRPDDLKPIQGDYRIMAGDLLSVSVADLVAPGVETVKSVRVSNSGKISLPLIGEVPAAEMSEAQLERNIADTYRANKIIASAQVSVSITEARGRQVSLLGAVRQPGAYPLIRPDMRLLDVLAQGGGVVGSPDRIRVVRSAEIDLQTGAVKPLDEPRTIEIAAGRLLSGDAAVNLVVRPADTIIVGTGESTRASGGVRSGAADGETLELDRKRNDFDLQMASAKLRGELGVEEAQCAALAKAVEQGGASQTELQVARARLESLRGQHELVEKEIQQRQQQQKAIHEEQQALLQEQQARQHLSERSAPEVAEPLRAALDRRLPEVHLDNIALTDALDFMRDVTGTNLVVNWKALAAAGVAKDAPVTVRVRDVKFSNALQLVLDQAAGASGRLTFVPADNVITVTTTQDVGHREQTPPANAGLPPAAAANPPRPVPLRSPSTAPVQIDLPTEAELGIAASDSGTERLEKLQAILQQTAAESRSNLDELNQARAQHGPESGIVAALQQRRTALQQRLAYLSSLMDDAKRRVEKERDEVRAREAEERERAAKTGSPPAGP